MHDFSPTFPVFGGNFVLTKVPRGADQCQLLGVKRCLLGGPKMYLLYGKINRGQVIGLLCMQKLFTFLMVRYLRVLLY